MAKITKLFLDFEAGTAKFNAPIKKAQRNLKSFGTTASKQSKIFAGMKARILGVVGPVVILAGAVKGLSSALGNFRKFEVLSAQLKVATGSAQQGRIEFSNLTELAKTMPGTLEELTGSFIKLKNFGLDASNESMISFANTAAATGKSLDQFVEAVADAASREFERLKEFGILTKNQGDTIAFTFRGMTTTVKNNSKAIQGFLKGIGEQEFAGSIAAQLDTLDTKISNVGDAWAVFSAAVAEGAIGDTAKSFLTSMTDILNDKTLQIKIGELKELNSNKLKLVGLEDLTTLKAYRDSLATIISSAQTFGQSFDNPFAPQKKLGPTDDEQERLKLVDERIHKLELEKQAVAGINQIFVEATKVATKNLEIEEGRSRLRKLITDEGKKDLTGTLKIKSLNEDIMTQWETIAEIRRDLVSGVDSKEQDGLAKSFTAAHESIRKMKAEIISTRTELEKTDQAAVRFNTSFAEGLARGIVLGGNLKSVLSNIIQQLAISGLTNMLLPLIGGATGGGGIGGFVSKAFGGARAEGGPVSPGKSFLVGEKAPELFTPRQSGMITPLKKLGGSIITNVTNYFDIRGSPQEQQTMIANSVEASVALAIAEGQNLKTRGFIN